MRNAILLLLLSFFTLGCDQKTSESTVQAPSVVNDSFAIVALKNQPVNSSTEITPSKDHARVRINKSSLEKEFLWHAEFIAQLSVPKFNGLKSRVVAFRLRGDKLYLVEATQGHAITTDLPQTLILAVFPVTFQDDLLVEFDFNLGMSEIFMASEWRASDFTGAAYQGGGEFMSVKAKYSYIHNAKINTQNELVIVQRAVLETQPMGIAIVNTPVEVRHYISPYIVNENFSPLRTVNFDRMGFFEVAPQLAPGSATDVFASRFDPRPDNVITYAVSANTPADFKNAVREGVLYWNRVFGYEKIKVVDAPAGVTAPDSEYNIVQWVDWDGAGAAYADAQADPRTGEIRHAQVFMTSAFAFSSRNRARMLLRELNSSKKSTGSFSLGGLAHSTLCDRENSDHLTHLLTDVVSTDIPDSRILQISQDYIREVVAHEIGHTLGLRHNFAGNLSANFDISTLDSIFETYIKSDSLPEKIVFSSSVMEYLHFTSSVMAGRLLAKPDESAFSYDKAAIEVLYGGAELSPTNTPVFCTDSHMGRFVGCTVWDQGPSPLADASYNEQKFINYLAKDLIEKIILSKTPPANLSIVNIPDIILYPDVVAKQILSKRSLVLQLLTEGAQDLRVQRTFGKLDAVNADQVAEKTLTATAAEITRLGGLKTLLALPSPSLSTYWTDNFNTLIETPAYREGVGYNGKPYKFSDTDILAAKELAAQYFTKIQEHLALADITTLTTITGTIADNILTDVYAEILASRAQEYLLSESGEIIRDRVILGENKSAVLALPIFKYKAPIRLAATKLLVGRTSTAPDWGLAGHNTVKNNFIEKVKAILMGNDIKTIRADKNPREVSKWLVENKALIAALSARD